VKSCSAKFIAALNCKKIVRIHCKRRFYLSVIVTVVSLRAEHWANRGILVYNMFLISISNSVSDGATNKSVLNIESS